ncbi:MAG: ABC transporter permease [Candidatus Sumerlaeota bacterium]|nr:ABC transporter permease [Candidatus Sumerlaeota bacterium]
MPVPPATYSSPSLSPSLSAPLSPPLSPARRAWQRLRRNRGAMAGLVAIAIISLAAIVGPWLSPYAFDEMDYVIQNQGPSPKHWFGADESGRDLFTRCLCGARVSLLIGVAASLISLVIGVTYGAISGYAGGKVDAVMMRFVEVIYGIPLLLIVILLMVAFQPGLTIILVALGMTFWLKMARIVRGQALSIKENDYVAAARGLGAGHARIIFRHLLPNMTGPIIVTLTLTIPEAIFAEAFLSLIGLGISAPNASLGTLVADGYAALAYYPHLFLFPAAIISLTMMAFNFLGDGLRDALDPGQR